MRRISKFNELYKSTFLDAARKLSDDHPTRSKKLIDWAKNGISNLNNIPREDAHPYVFSDNKTLKKYNPDEGDIINDKLLSTFFIIGISVEDNLRSQYRGVLVKFMNDWGQIVKIRFVWGLVGDSANYFSLKFSTIDQELTNNFLFSNRKDAMRFLRFVRDYLSDSDSDDCLPDNELPKPSINKMYYTE